MNLTIPRADLPLAADSNGVVRIGGTRIPIDTVIGAFNDGMTAEEIVANYGSLKLFDVYYTIGFYLQHKLAVDTYLQEREQQAEEIRAEIELRNPSDGIRERLLSRQAARKAP